jgi:predicted phosphodiesterase
VRSNTFFRLHVLSDLHLEADGGFRPPPVDADVLIIAGDVAPGTAGIRSLAAYPSPVVYVPGNHEYYDADYTATRLELRAAATEAGIWLLDSGECRIDGVRILGTTLWTDFCVYGAGRLSEALEYGRRRVVDFRTIRREGELLQPQDTIGFHADAVRWLGERLEDGFEGPTVVVTHHAPHPLSIHARWRDHAINPAFVSDLSALMGKAALWIHGHTHDSCDYEVAGTRVVCNPKGYGAENSSFRPDFVVTV